VFDDDRWVVRSGFFTFDEPVHALAAHSRRLTARHEAHIVMLPYSAGRPTTLMA